MAHSSSITFCRFDGFLWIRCSDRANFSNSPTLKAIGDEYINEGGRLIVVDLENCTGIDSTFMGTLVGLSRRLIPADGEVQIASPSDRCLEAMESLGLDALLNIEPPTAPWRGKLEQIRASLNNEGVEHVHLESKAHTRHILDSHLTLSELSDENKEKFRSVTDCLKDELKRQEEKNQ